MPDEELVQRLAMLHHLTGSLSRLRLPREQFAPREPASNSLSRMINHSSTLKATLFAPPNQGVRDLCRSPCDAYTPQVQARSRFAVRARFSLRAAARPWGGQAGQVRYGYRPRQLSRRTKACHFATTKSTLPSHPLLAQSHSRFSTPHNRRFRAMLTISVSFALPHRDPTCVDFVCVLFRFRLHLRASLRRPHGANPIRLRRGFCRSCACD